MPAPRRRGLGRGLDALLSPTTEHLPRDPEGDEVVLVEVAVDAVVPNPEQPRQEFDEAELDQLAESIRLHGLLQPIVVEREAPGRYRLIADERRLRAARMAGLTGIPAVVRPASESRRDALELALIENLQRSDLGPMEEAVAYQRLSDAFGLSADAIALRVGRSRPAVANTVRLLALPPEIQIELRQRLLSAGHGRALLAVEEDDARIRLARRTVEEGLTVRQLESLAQGSRPAPAAAPSGDAPIAASSASEADLALTRGLEEVLGTPVRVERRRRGGRLVIDFFDDDQLGGIYSALGGRSL